MAKFLRRETPSALDDLTLDALLEGRVAPDDVPPDYVAAASVLRAVDAPLSPEEQADDPALIRRIFEDARRGPLPVGGGRPADRRERSWSLKAAVVALIGAATLGGGVAMAETGSLPGPLQSAASHVLGVVGLTVPDGSSGGGESDLDGPSTTVAGEPAGADQSSTTQSTSSDTDDDEAGDPTTTPTTDATGVPGRGDEVCEVASDGQCRAGEPNPSDTRPGKPDEVGPPTTKDNPSVTAPGQVKTTEPPVTQPPVTAPPVTAPPVTQPSPPTTKDNPSATAPGKGKPNEAS